MTNKHVATAVSLLPHMQRYSVASNVNRRKRCDSFPTSNLTGFAIFITKTNTHHGQGKRLFIKDITYYLFPPDEKPAEIAPSLAPRKRGIGTAPAASSRVNGANVHANGNINGGTKTLPFPYGTACEEGNPTVVPHEFLQQFHFTFLIRDPHYSISSFYRCTVPPLEDITQFHDFYPNEAGYNEVRRMFDYCRKTGLVGPKHRSQANGQENGAVNGINGDAKEIEICVLDADDLLNDPEGIMKGYCKSVGLEYTPDMLNWDSKHDQIKAERAFEKWKGWHEDALDSKDLKPRAHVCVDFSFS